MNNVGLMHLTRTNIATIRSFFHYLQDCLPAKLHSIHVLNVVSFFNKILALVKPFMNAEIFKALHLHSTNIDWDDFYENVIPKSSLPSGQCTSFVIK
jgi:CRAL/TRIO domain